MAELAALWGLIKVAAIVAAILGGTLALFAFMQRRNQP